MRPQVVISCRPSTYQPHYNSIDWDVQHKFPVNDRGTNAFDNLILIRRQSEHNIFIKTQGTISKDMLPGDSQQVLWPVPKGIVYPRGFVMTEIENVVFEFRKTAEQLDYVVYEPVQFPESLYLYDFGRKVGVAPLTFWEQYKAFVKLADGFHIDGVYIYGIEDHADYENNLFSYNNALADIYNEAPGLLIEEMQYCIEFGSSSLDTFYYDVKTNKWESRDRFQYDNLFITSNTLTEFLDAVLVDIRKTT